MPTNKAYREKLLDTDDRRIPITVLTGFLGSGKTTILNHLVNQPAMARALVIINEFGEIGLDHMLVTHSTEQGMVQMSSGCLCCTIRTDLVQTLKNIVWRFSIRGERLFDRVLIETTGLADPAPVVHTLVAEPSVTAHYRLDGVVTVVDSLHGASTIDTHDEALRQIAVADKCLLSKADLVNEESRQKLLGRISEINPGVEIVPVLNGQVNPGAITGLGLFDAQGKHPDVARWLAQYRDDQLPGSHEHAHHTSGGHDVNRHDASISAHSFLPDGAINSNELQAWFEAVAAEIGDRLLRLKGILKAGDSAGPVVIHAVQHVMHPPAELSAWPVTEQCSRLVFITRNVAREKIEDLVSRLPYTV